MASHLNPFTNSNSTSLNQDISLRSLRRSNQLRPSTSADENMSNSASSSRPQTPVSGYPSRQTERWKQRNLKGKERDSDPDEIDLLGSGKRKDVNKVIRGEGEIEGQYDDGWKGEEGDEEQGLLGASTARLVSLDYIRTSK